MPTRSSPRSKTEPFPEPIATNKHNKGVHHEDRRSERLHRWHCAHLHGPAEARRCRQGAGDEVKIETQGTIGVENELTAQDIADADIVILAIDIKIANEERFAGKKVVKVSTETAIKAPNKLIAKLHEIAEK